MVLQTNGNNADGPRTRPAQPQPGQRGRTRRRPDLSSTCVAVHLPAGLGESRGFPDRTGPGVFQAELQPSVGCPLRAGSADDHRRDSRDRGALTSIGNAGLAPVRPLGGGLDRAANAVADLGHRLVQWPSMCDFARAGFATGLALTGWVSIDDFPTFTWASSTALFGCWTTLLATNIPACDSSIAARILVPAVPTAAATTSTCIIERGCCGRRSRRNGLNRIPGIGQRLSGDVGGVETSLQNFVQALEYHCANHIHALDHGHLQHAVRVDGRWDAGLDGLPVERVEGVLAGRSR